MRAVRQHVYGEPMRLDDIAEPVAATGEVLVRLCRAAVNPIDIWASRGSVGGGSPLPRTLGGEGAGVTADGDRVVIRGGGLGITRDGTYAEWVAAPAQTATPIPDGVSDAQAAGVGIAGVTALDCLERSAVARGGTLLVLGASGGVGSFALRLARNRGVRTVAQTSTAGRAATLADAADVVVTGDADGLVAAIHAAGVDTVDAVLDPLGAGYTAAAVRVLAAGGRIVMFGASAGSTFTVAGAELYRKGVSIIGYGGLAIDAATLRIRSSQLLDEIARGALDVVVADELDLADANAAHRRILERRAGGKLLLVCS
jgi:NADPH:quinone reductase